MPEPLTKDDYTLEKEKSTPKDDKIEREKIPIYMEPIKLPDDRKKDLVDEFFKEYDAIVEERNQESFEQKCDALDRQYDGKITEDEARQFNLNRKITKKYVDKVVTLIMQAFFESNPRYSVTPRPEFQREGGEDICDKQGDFLDYKLDEVIPLRPPFGLTAHSTVLKGNGILKLKHHLRRESRKREERYKGNPMPVINEETMTVAIDPATKKPKIRNKGLEEFLQNWPDGEKKYPNFVKQLQEGKEINIVASYKDTVYNDPLPKYVDIKNLYVRTTVEGNQGLPYTRLVAERMNFTYWELMQFAEDNHLDMDEVNKIIYEDDDKEVKKEMLKDCYTRSYDIFEGIFYFKEKKDDKEEIKLTVFIAEDRRKVLGVFYYPYYGVDCYYIDHTILKKKPGFYQPGMGEDLTDSNIAQNAFLNHALEGVYVANTITPITKENSDLDKQFLEKRWAHGIPLNANKGEVDFLQKYLTPPDLGAMLSLMQYLKQDDDDVTRVSSYLTGKESPTDPSAPAAKTIALLRESGIDIKDYISTMLPSFNLFGTYILQLYHQMSNEGRKYRINPERVAGNNPFGEISRHEMTARTNIQCQAFAFNFDKINEKREDIAMFSVVRQELIVARNPEAVYFLLKNLVKGWSPKWKNLVNKILPPLEEFKKKQLATAVQAVALYVQQKKQLEQQTGQKAEFKTEELIPMMNDMLAEQVTPVDEKVAKEREKNANRQV